MDTAQAVFTALQLLAVLVVVFAVFFTVEHLLISRSERHIDNDEHSSDAM